MASDDNKRKRDEDDGEEKVANKTQKVSHSNENAPAFYEKLRLEINEVRDVNSRKEAVFTQGKLRFPNSLLKCVQQETMEGKCLKLREYTGQRLGDGKHLIVGGVGEEKETGTRLLPKSVHVHGSVDLTFDHGHWDEVTFYVYHGASLKLLCYNPDLVVTIYIYNAGTIKVEGICKSVSIVAEGTPGDTLVDCLDLKIGDENVTTKFEPSGLSDKFSRTYIIYPSGKCKVHVANSKEEEWGNAGIQIADMRKTQSPFSQPCWLRELRNGEADGFIKYYVSN